MTNSASIVYIPHGGGPLPLLGHSGHESLVKFLKNLGRQLPLPEAVIVISAHWEMDIPVITSGPNPHLIYDYFGFPDAAYEIQYPAPGAPDLAKQVLENLSLAGIKARTDEKRGFDHGVFVPLTLMLPTADIPCIQISLCADLCPSSHLKIGEALTEVAKKNIWILGSGFSFHNMSAFTMDKSVPDEIDEQNNQFQDWLMETCTGQKFLPEQRKERLIKWEFAPFARTCHPREEHLLPLLVCMAVAGYRPAKVLFDDTIMGRRALAFCITAKKLP
ncbi:MAG: dioxygenase [Desulfobacterales bacterium]|nr:dioxygenase [Desulfobacterales bacterium]